MFQRISCSIRYLSSSVIVDCRCIGGSFAIEESGIRGIRAHVLEDVGAESSLKPGGFRGIHYITCFNPRVRTGHSKFSEIYNISWPENF